jgi:hypothetical protein
VVARDMMWMERNRKSLDLMLGRSARFHSIERNRKWLDLMLGRSAMFDSIEGNRKWLDSISGRNAVLDMVENSRKALDSISGRSAMFGAIESNRRWLETISGRNSALGMVEQSRKLLDSITGRGLYSLQFGAADAIAQVGARPDFSSMIGSVAMPRPAWAGLFDGLREGIGADLRDEAVAEFNAAADLAGQDDTGTWWVFRLPLVVQLALLVLALQVVDKASEFMVDLAGGDDLPPAYRSGTQVLFALVAVLLAVIDTKASADAESADDDESD